jgi:cell division protein FtsZ
MQGAKGVIISIIGGDDMKLLEVDEAANHIRELVDPEANIIWGSAFNPDLDGKIRVSVVATGIEQTGEMAMQASQPFSMGMSRGPKKPVLPLPTEAELAEDAAATSPEEPSYGGEGYGAEPEEAPERHDYQPAMPQAFEAEGEAEHTEGEEGLAEPADDSAYGATTDDGYASLSGTRIERDPEAGAPGTEDWGDPAEYDEEGEGEDALELTAEDAGEPPASGNDELLLDASRLAEQDEPMQSPLVGRRRGILGSGSGEDEAAPEVPQRRANPAPAATGSTLFERMANLSRANSGNADEEEEEEESGGGSALRIPRFLGRQNNQ